jgi:hypothetical protein
MRLAPVVLVLPLLLPLGGCYDVLAAVFFANAGSLMLTGGTVPDVLISAVAGKHCSLARLENGRTYCREDEPNPPSPVRCYRTLGDPDCYLGPEVPDNPRQEIGLNDHNRPHTPLQPDPPIMPLELMPSNMN